MGSFHLPTMLLRAIIQKSRAFERHIETLTKVNPTDREVMETLIMGGPQSPSQLATAVGLSPAAMTSSIDRLTGLGHAHREAHSSDRRKTVVRPSDESVRIIMNELMGMVRGINAVMNDYSEAEIAIITRFLTDVNNEYANHINPEDVVGYAAAQ
ncbi:DNA-binding MarR family transcriptional regulator [Microbacteriaceae bacterium MWH-Ta3]|nr:DNA-binding MarR family transcriptional regulator [Microbacteriaceae bacterium MWH-Ta3]